MFKNHRSIFESLYVVRYLPLNSTTIPLGAVEFDGPSSLRVLDMTRLPLYGYREALGDRYGRQLHL
jgi:hypothetical protein